MLKTDFKRYYDHKCFEKEKEYIFSKLWVYACSVADFREEKNYILTKTPFGEIIISYDNGKYFAFHNKCLHRGHPIVRERVGKTNFVCPYHCWSYYPDGKLKKIPYMEKMYGFENKKISKIKLQEVKLAQIGDFIFINASKSPLPIEKQFNEKILKSLEKTKNKLDKTNCFLSVELDFNWKLIFENLRDCLHPTFLHSKSLNKEVDFFATFREPKINKKKIKDFIEISSFSRDGETKLEQQNYKSDFLSCDDGKSYLNWLLFPYTHIPSPDGGTLFCVENYVPVSSTKTRVDLHFYITKSKGRSSKLAIFYDWFERAKIVLKEDLEAIQSLQKQCEYGQKYQNLGNFENQNLRINEFFDEKIYKK